MGFDINDAQDSSLLYTYFQNYITFLLVYLCPHIYFEAMSWGFSLMSPEIYEIIIIT